MSFAVKAPRLMSRLIKEFGIEVEDAAAVAGNGGHESGGFKKLQEINPTVKGSRGGYGWFQWTGPRRRAFEKFCGQRSLRPSSDEANIGFIVYELKGSEGNALDAMARANGLYNKVVAFEKSYERAGIKHYPSRHKWAQKALAAYGGKTAPSKWMVASGGGAAAGTGFIATFGEAAASSLGYSLADMMSWQFLLGAGVVTGVLAAVVLVAMGHDRRERLWDRLFGGWLS